MSDLSLTYGESRFLDIAVTDENGAAVPITGSSFWLMAKADWLDADSAALFTLSVGSGITITDGPNGLAEAKIDADEWTSIPNEPGRLVWGLVERDSGGDVWRLDQGRIIVGAAAKATVP